MIQNSKFKIQNLSNNGFTLLELIVVMAIISIMSAVVISGYSGQRDSKALSLGESQVINDIRIAQSKSYNVLSTNGTNFPKGGYGIRFTKDSNSYVVFADDAVSPAVPNKVYNLGEEIETVELPKNVKVSDLEKDKDGVITNPAIIDIVFQPPWNRVFIDGEEKTAGDNFINLEIEIKNQGGSTKTIEVSSSRLIK